MNEPSTETAVTLRRVLIVDDNREGADMLARLVRVDGHDVRTAYTGQTALELVDSFAPELVILDVCLPDLSGPEVAKQIRARENSNRILLAALTGLDSDEDRAVCEAAGFDDYFVKPLNLAALRRLVARA